MLSSVLRSKQAVAVKRVLRRRGVQRDHFDLLLPSIMAQAEELYRDWPLAA